MPPGVPISYGAAVVSEPRELQSRSNLIIGIDFGTTFSGVAYSHSGVASGSANDGEASRIAQNVSVIKTWPNPSLLYTEKIPTVIAYHTDPPTWGRAVKPGHEPRVVNFKLGLEPRVPQHYGTQTSNNAPAFGTHPKLPGKKAVDFAADYLTCIYKFVHNDFLPKQFGEEFLRNQYISYIITVPAIWTDLAKDLTRQAACRAGFPDERLLLISEPEAAALYCATASEEVDLCDGERFLVCDAGGGTVVCIFL